MKTCGICGHSIPDNEFESKPEDHDKNCSVRIIMEINSVHDEIPFLNLMMVFKNWRSIDGVVAKDN